MPSSLCRLFTCLFMLQAGYISISHGRHTNQANDQTADIGTVNVKGSHSVANIKKHITNSVDYDQNIIEIEKCQKSSGNKFICKNGESIYCSQLCDGYKDCSDNSDENQKLCELKEKLFLSETQYDESDNDDVRMDTEVHVLYYPEPTTVDYISPTTIVPMMDPIDQSTITEIEKTTNAENEQKKTSIKYNKNNDLRKIEIFSTRISGDNESNDSFENVKNNRKNTRTKPHFNENNADVKFSKAASSNTENIPATVIPTTKKTKFYYVQKNKNFKEHMVWKHYRTQITLYVQSKYFYSYGKKTLLYTYVETILRRDFRKILCHYYEDFCNKIQLTLLKVSALSDKTGHKSQALIQLTLPDGISNFGYTLAQHIRHKKYLHTLRADIDSYYYYRQIEVSSTNASTIEIIYTTTTEKYYPIKPIHKFDIDDLKNCKISTWNSVSCKNGEIIACHQLCDGTADCSDNSDEDVHICVLNKNITNTGNQYSQSINQTNTIIDKIDNVKMTLDSANIISKNLVTPTETTVREMAKNVELTTDKIFYDIKEIDVFKSSDFNKCQSSPWSSVTCKNGQIIACHQLCDSYIDCGDNSDEDGQMCLHANDEVSMEVPKDTTAQPQNDVLNTTETNVQKMSNGEVTIEIQDNAKKLATNYESMTTETSHKKLFSEKNVTTKKVAIAPCTTKENVICQVLLGCTDYTKDQTLLMNALKTIEENQHLMLKELKSQKVLQTEQLKIKKKQLENEVNIFNMAFSIKRGYVNRLESEIKSIDQQIIHNEINNLKVMTEADGKTQDIGSVNKDDYDEENYGTKYINPR